MTGPIKNINTTKYTKYIFSRRYLKGFDELTMSITRRPGESQPGGMSSSISLISGGSIFICKWMEENHNHISITSNNLDKLITNILVNILISLKVSKFIWTLIYLWTTIQSLLTFLSTFSLEYKLIIHIQIVCLATSNSMHIEG